MNNDLISRSALLAAVPGRWMALPEPPEEE